MKFLFIIIFSLLYFFTSAANEEYIRKLDQSLRVWKRLSPCVYSYSTSFESWVGFGHRTKIKVAQGRVVRREFESWELYLTVNSTIRVLEHWIERGPNQIGTHSSGFDPLTMEQIYKQCRDLIRNLDLEENELYLEFDNRGILKQCQYYPLLCADDCLFGISLEQVVLGNRPLQDMEGMLTNNM